MSLDHLRRPDQTPEEFKEYVDDVILLFSFYYIERCADAGYPYGRTWRGLLRWVEHGGQVRAN